MGVYSIQTYYGLFGKRRIVELPSSTYGEWIIYEENKPKFHINTFRSNSTSDRCLRELLETDDLSIEQILLKINLTNTKNYSLGTKPKFFFRKTIESKDINLEPLPTYYLLEFVEKRK